MGPDAYMFKNQDNLYQENSTYFMFANIPVLNISPFNLISLELDTPKIRAIKNALKYVPRFFVCDISTVCRTDVPGEEHH